jgi:hypothetical protein
MKRRSVLVSLLASIGLLAVPAAGAVAGVAAHPDTVTVGPGGGTPGTWKNFVLVGHDPLFGRCMNSAAASYQHYIYIGNRTDGSSACGVGDPRGPGNNCPHPHPGVLIDDIADPAHPRAVGEIGPPLEGNPGISSRELRVWPRAKLLIVMNFRCSSVIHACVPGWAGAADEPDQPADHDHEACDEEVELVAVHTGGEERQAADASSEGLAGKSTGGGPMSPSC